MPILLVALFGRAPYMFVCMTIFVEHCPKRSLERGVCRGIQQYRLGIQFHPALSRLPTLGSYRKSPSSGWHLPLLEYLSLAHWTQTLFRSLPLENTRSKSEKALTIMSGSYPYSSASSTASISLSVAADSVGATFLVSLLCQKISDVASTALTDGPLLG